MGFTPAQYECDKCGALKREVNKWYILRFRDDIRVLTIIPFIEAEAQRYDEQQILCSDSCLIKTLSEILPTMHEATT